MKSRNTQLAVALLILVGFGIAILFVRSGFSKEERVSEAPTTRRKPLAPASNSIDVGASSAIGQEGDGYYSEVKSTARAGAASDEEVSDEDLTEEECQAFVTHIQALEGKADPSAKADFSDPEAVEAMGAMCKKDGVSPRFARCAMTKQSTADFIDCGGDEITESMKHAEEILREFKKSQRASR